MASVAARPAPDAGAPVPPGTRRVVTVLFGIGAAAVVLTVMHALGVLGEKVGEPFEDWVYSTAFLAPATICLLRAAHADGERLAWMLIGAGLVTWTLGWWSYVLFVEPLPTPPYPSVADGFWLLFYPLVYAGFVLLLRRRVAHLHRGLGLDALVAALALAAVGAEVLVGPILESTGGRPAAVATNMAYPLGDFLIMSVALLACALSGWRPGRAWLLLAGGMGVQVVADVIYLRQAAVGAYEQGTLLDVTWLVAALAVAAGAWQPAVRVEGERREGWQSLIVPLGFTLLAFVLLIYGRIEGVGDAAFALSLATLVAAFVRAALMFGDLRSLSVSRELLERNEAILDSAGEGIFGLDAEGRMIFANRAAAVLTGHSADELIGRSAHELVHHTRPDGSAYPAAECPVMRTLADGVEHQVTDELYWRRDGSSFPVEYTATPIVRGRRVEGAVVVFRDVSERQEIDRMKDEFISVVSHELRTPLTSIRGSLGLLAGGVVGEVPERAQRMLDIAVGSTDRLIRLINDILDVERIEAGRIAMEREEVELGALLRRVSEQLEGAAREAGVELRVEAPEATVCADPDRVTQALANLVGNAIKFSPPGAGVRLAAEPAGREVVLRVADRGRGIPADKLDTIFDRFAQVDASDARQKGGTGLGLPISKAIVEQHGGRIWVESTEGEGSTFSFTLPALGRRDGAAAGGVRATVLVCDDDPRTLETVAATLEEHGYRPLTAETGAAALETALAHRPDAILLEMSLPGMSGWETAAALRERAETRRIPILILSLADGRAVLDGGRAGLLRPVEASSLVQALETALAERGRVLVVEDDADLAETLVSALEAHGLEVHHALTGPQAVEMGRATVPDLVVLDLGLPGFDGFEVVDRLRADERLASVPVAVYSARELGDHEHRRLGHGPTAVFTKGRVTPEEFERRVLELLGRLAGVEPERATA